VKEQLSVVFWHNFPTNCWLLRKQKCVAETTAKKQVLAISLNLNLFGL